MTIEESIDSAFATTEAKLTASWAGGILKNALAVLAVPIKAGIIAGLATHEADIRASERAAATAEIQAELAALTTPPQA